MPNQDLIAQMDLIFQEFQKKVSEAREEYHKKIEDILKNIDERNLGEARKKLLNQ